MLILLIENNLQRANMATPLSQVKRFQENPAKDPTREDKSDIFLRIIEYTYRKNGPCDTSCLPARVAELCGANPIFGEMILRKAAQRGIGLKVDGFENEHSAKAEAARLALPKSIREKMKIWNANIFMFFHDEDSCYDAIDLDLCHGPRVKEIVDFANIFNNPIMQPRVAAITTSAKGRAIKGFCGTTGRYGLLTKLMSEVFLDYDTCLATLEDLPFWEWSDCSGESGFNAKEEEKFYKLTSEKQIEVIARAQRWAIESAHEKNRPRGKAKIRFLYQRLYWGGNGHDKKSPMIVQVFADADACPKGMRIQEYNDLVSIKAKNPIMVEAGKKAWATRRSNAMKKAA